MSIRRSLAMLKFTEYNEVLERALMVEMEEEEFGKIREKRKEGRVDSQGRRQKPKLGTTRPNASGNACYQCGQVGHRKAECPQIVVQVPRAAPRPTNPTYGQQQVQQPKATQGQGQNPRRQMICYQCGQQGHARWECPQLQGALAPRAPPPQPQFRPPPAGRGQGGRGRGPYPQPQQPRLQLGPRPPPAARVQTMIDVKPPIAANVQAVTDQEAQTAEGVVTGTLVICGHLAYVLFDPGATHSFIASHFVEKIGLKTYPMSAPMHVSTPLRVTLRTTQMCPSCEVVIGDNTLSADLVVLDMKDLDVILGMD